MAEVLLFHHAHGLTSGILSFAESLRQAGHTVHTPDLYNGRIFDTLNEGVAHAQEVGIQAIVERGRAVAEALPGELVYAGFSLGVLPAQTLACSRAGAGGALLFHACLAMSGLGGAWPPGVPVQIHAMDSDEIFIGEGDIEAARALVQSTSDAELFLYPGTTHLFADSSLPSYNEHAATLLMERVLGFLERQP